MVSPSSGPAIPDGTAALLADLARTQPEINGEEEEDNEPLIDKVQKRLEELLSKQNLAEDAYIQQHMNAQMYIPLAVLARHHSLCILGEEDIIIATSKEAAQRSEKIGVDEDGMMVRPLLKPRRNTIILHGLPDEFPEEELKALFDSSPESESFCSLKPDVNNTAFASFKTDEAAQSVALWLRSQKLYAGSDEGTDIKCAIKSEHFVRSFFPASAGPSMQAASPYMGYSHHPAWGYPPWMPVHGGGWSGPQGEQFVDPTMGNEWGWGDASSWMPDAVPQGSYQRDPKGDGKGKSQKGKGKGRKRGSSMEGPMTGSFSQESQMEASNSEPMGPGMEMEGAIEGLAEPGYTHEYRKYSRQYIIEVCNAMAEEQLLKPESYERCEQNEVALFRSSPCKDWAPLPTPMTDFASGFPDFFGKDRRGSDGQESEGLGKGERTTRKASWGPKGSRASPSESHDYEESDWTHADSSWWKTGAAGADSKRRSDSASWGSWDYSDYKQSDGGYGQQQWVKKEEAEWEEGGGPRKMSWAEKVKDSMEPSDRPQRWVAKAKTSGDTKTQEKECGADPGLDSAPAAAPPAAEGVPAATEAAPAAAGEVASEATAAAPRKPSWADKVRAAASK